METKSYLRSAFKLMLIMMLTSMTACSGGHILEDEAPPCVVFADIGGW